MSVRRLSVMVIAAAVLVQAGSAATASVSAKTGLKKAYVSTRVLRADSVKGKKFLTIAILSTTGAETGVTIDELIELTKTAFKRL